MPMGLMGLLKAEAHLASDKVEIMFRKVFLGILLAYLFVNRASMSKMNSARSIWANMPTFASIPSNHGSIYLRDIVLHQLTTICSMAPLTCVRTLKTTQVVPKSWALSISISPKEILVHLATASARGAMLINSGRVIKY